VVRDEKNRQGKSEEQQGSTEARKRQGSMCVKGGKTVVRLLFCIAGQPFSFSIDSCTFPFYTPLPDTSNPSLSLTFSLSLLSHTALPDTYRLPYLPCPTNILNSGNVVCRCNRLCLYLLLMVPCTQSFRQCHRAEGDVTPTEHIIHTISRTYLLDPWYFAMKTPVELSRTFDINPHQPGNRVCQL